MKRYFIILVRGKAMHPTGGEPYRFKTLKEAKNIVSICYGLASLNSDVKIVSSTDFFST